MVQRRVFFFFFIALKQELKAIHSSANNANARTHFWLAEIRMYVCVCIYLYVVLLFIFQFKKYH